MEKGKGKIIYYLNHHDLRLHPPPRLVFCITGWALLTLRQLAQVEEVNCIIRSFKPPPFRVQRGHTQADR